MCPATKHQSLLVSHRFVVLLSQDVADMSKVSKSQISKALQNFASLREVITELTEEEVLAALQLESATQRRESVLNRLISRAARLNEIKYVANLRRNFHG